jgi:NAD(P)-dependent dehydrogenase (short-subunit alcohol dehydrogenase family)
MVPHSARQHFRLSTFDFQLPLTFETMDRAAVLVTGASKGIGEACALRLCARGLIVLAGVRKVEDGEALRRKTDSDRLIPLQLDVTVDEQVRSAAVVVEEHCGGRGLAGLVNNAGIAVAGPMEFLPIDEFRRQLEVNVVGQLAVTQALLPALRRGRGRIVFMSSIAGRSAMPFTGAYGASKHAIEAIADSLRVELMDAGIEVSVVEPGMIATPIWETSTREADRIMKDMPPQLSQYYGRPLEGLRRIANRGVKGAPPELVADAVENALTASRPKPRYVVGKDAKIRLLMERLLPTRLRDRVIANRLKRI